MGYGGGEGFGPDHSRSGQATCGLATPTARTLSSLLVQSARLRECLPHAPSPPTSVVSGHDPPRKAPVLGGSRLVLRSRAPYPLGEDRRDTTQHSLPTKDAELPEEPQLLTAEALSPCPGCPWPRRAALLEPSHLERRDRLGGERRIPRPPPALAARRRPLSEPGEPHQAHPQAQSLCERAPCARSRVRAHSLAPTT